MPLAKHTLGEIEKLLWKTFSGSRTKFDMSF